MNCVFPPELDDGQLLAYLDGETDHGIATHLAQCPYCREKARQVSHWHQQLTTRLYRVTCPTSIELGDYHFGLVSTSQAVAIARHVSECPHCQREVAQLRDYLRGELAPPSEVGPLERMKVLVARLVTGPDRAPVSAGIRGEATGPITWEADGVLVVLDIQPAADGRAKILGQVAADDQDYWTGAQVELRQAGELQATVTVDDLGAFRCEAVSPGSAEILITPSRGSPILVPNVEIID
jgi:hypothetical protein